MNIDIKDLLLRWLFDLCCPRRLSSYKTRANLPGKIKTYLNLCFASPIYSVLIFLLYHLQHCHMKTNLSSLLPQEDKLGLFLVFFITTRRHYCPLFTTWRQSCFFPRLFHYHKKTTCHHFCLLYYNHKTTKLSSFCLLYHTDFLPIIIGDEEIDK